MSWKRLGITECLGFGWWIANAASTAKANQTASEPKAGSPIERDVGNYEQVVIWGVSAKKAKFWGEGM